MSMTTKLSRGLTYHKGVPPIKAHDPLTTRSYKII